VDCRYQIDASMVTLPERFFVATDVHVYAINATLRQNGKTRLSFHLSACAQ